MGEGTPASGPHGRAVTCVVEVLDGEGVSGALLSPARCWYIGAAQPVLGSDRWLMPREARSSHSLVAELGSLLQVEGYHGLLQVFVPAS